MFDIDIIKLNQFLTKLPEGEWTLSIFVENVEALNEFFGVSDEYIKNCFVDHQTDSDVNNIKWQILVDSMLEYTKFSNEYYDALKYNSTSNLSISKIKLLNELMMTFKLIKEESKKLYEKYEPKKFSKKLLQQFNLERITLEFLLLRILYIALNIKIVTDENLEKFAKILSLERISLNYHKTILQKHN